MDRFLERVLRDRRNGRLGDNLVPYAELEEQICAEVTNVCALNVVDLSGDCPGQGEVPYGC